MSYYSKTSDEVVKEFNVDINSGLSNEEANKRLLEYGENKLLEKKGRTVLGIFLDQFKDFLVIILIVAAVISIYVGEMIDGSIILAIVVLNAVLGTMQENKASNALKALKEMSSPMAKVLRSGEIIKVSSKEIVPGDIVLLEAGDYVPSDIRLLESASLKIDESSLTGESVPVEKDSNKVLEEDLPIGDRVNYCYMSSVITYGRGKGIATGTGMNTEIGKIAGMLNDAKDEKTPLQAKLDSFGKMLGVMCIVVCAVIFGLGIFRGRDLLEVFLNAVALAVAAIPEGLTVVVTVILALGMQRMVKKNVIIKRLGAVETLGSTTVICSDKTGTLTQNKMTVKKVYDMEESYDISGTGYDRTGDILKDASKVEISEKLKFMLTGLLLCNDSEFKEEEHDIVGDPTEGALVVLAAKAGLYKHEVEKSMKRIAELPFDSDRKLMSTFHEDHGKVLMFAKGGPDELLKKCTHIYKDGKIVELKKEHIDEIESKNDEYARNALRVLAISFRNLDNLDNFNEKENNLVFLGLVGMIDPPREEVKEAIKVCKKAGIRVIMITGDHKTTAIAIAEELGIIDDNKNALDGTELNSMDISELADKVKYTNVFARVSPEHKVKLVEAIKKNGEVASMTGDGVNDAPALKRADIGVAMGITGTDVSKEAADMILTDDNFTSIVDAVEEGRVIYSNIRKVVSYLLSCNIGEILLIFVAIIIGWESPLLATQLLAINLITDAFPAFSLGMEEKEEGIMDMPPRKKDEPIVDKTMIFGIAVQSIALAVAALFSYYFALRTYNSEVVANTFCFVTVVIGELLRAYSARSERRSIFKMNPFSNSFLNKSVIASLVFLLITIYVPFVRVVFKTVSLNMVQLSIAATLALIPFIGGELSKLTKKI